jgi:hypothetical protein
MFPSRLIADFTNECVLMFNIIEKTADAAGLVLAMFPKEIGDRILDCKDFKNMRRLFLMNMGKVINEIDQRTYYDLPSIVRNASKDCASAERKQESKQFLKDDTAVCSKYLEKVPAFDGGRILRGSKALLNPLKAPSAVYTTVFKHVDKKGGQSMRPAWTDYASLIPVLVDEENTNIPEGFDLSWVARKTSWGKYLVEREVPLCFEESIFKLTAKALATELPMDLFSSEVHAFGEDAAGQTNLARQLAVLVAASEGKAKVSRKVSKAACAARESGITLVEKPVKVDRKHNLGKINGLIEKFSNQVDDSDDADFDPSKEGSSSSSGDEEEGSSSSSEDEAGPAPKRRRCVQESDSD